MLEINDSPGTAPVPPAAAFAVTDAAYARIAYLLSDEPAGAWFWVSVLGGGCSGFQYNFALEARQPEAADFCIEQHGAKVAVDEVSLDLLKGSTLDYVDELWNAGFVMKNPNATVRCGCGNSFSVAL